MKEPMSNKAKAISITMSVAMLLIAATIIIWVNSLFPASTTIMSQMNKIWIETFSVTMLVIISVLSGINIYSVLNKEKIETVRSNKTDMEVLSKFRQKSFQKRLSINKI